MGVTILIVIWKTLLGVINHLTKVYQSKVDIKYRRGDIDGGFRISMYLVRTTVYSLLLRLWFSGHMMVYFDGYFGFGIIWLADFTNQHGRFESDMAR